MLKLEGFLDQKLGGVRHRHSQEGVDCLPMKGLALQGFPNASSSVLLSSQDEP